MQTETINELILNTPKAYEYVHNSKGKNDECYTKRYAVEPLLKYLDLFVIKKFAPVEFAGQTLTSPSFSSATCSSCSPQADTVAPLRHKLIIWCPFDKEDSEFVKVFQENGFQVVYSHIDYGQDFFLYEPAAWDILISNPPFTGKTEIFKRALSFGKPFALLMNVLWLNDATPVKVFRAAGRKLQLLMFDKRMDFKRPAAESGVNGLACVEQVKQVHADSFNARSKGNQPQDKMINFMSDYFCCDFLPEQIIFSDFKDKNQQSLFEVDT